MEIFSDIWADAGDVITVLAAFCFVVLLIWFQQYQRKIVLGPRSFRRRYIEWRGKGRRYIKRKYSRATKFKR